jgi:polyisoprenyl-phosphate glycosyltransferase
MITVPQSKRRHISIIIPAHNEEINVPLVFDAVYDVMQPLDFDFDITFINDGSTDATQTAIDALVASHPEAKSINFSRNFGKEAATTAGINECVSDALICLDADLQHPPTLIPEFIRAWENGAEIVVGVRNETKSDSILKRLGSKLYYHIMNSIAETEIIPRATDFRLIDRVVIDEFNRLNEHNRITRGLIDWLGFTRAYCYFDAQDREHGEASYTLKSLLNLALSSFINHSHVPLKLAGYVGVVITTLSSLLGLIMFLDRYIFTDWDMNFSGTAILANITLFLVGIIMMSLGLLSFYIAHIHHETQNRPLYIIRRKK